MCLECFHTWAAACILRQSKDRSGENAIRSRSDRPGHEDCHCIHIHGDETDVEERVQICSKKKPIRDAARFRSAIGIDVACLERLYRIARRYGALPTISLQ